MQENSQFSGGVFSEQIEGGRAGADIELGATSILAHTSTGQKFSIPYRDCQLELGGASGRMLFCRTPDRSVTIFCEDRRFMATLDREAAGELSQQLMTLRGKRAKEGLQWQLYLFLGTVFSLVVLVGGYYGLLAAAKAGTHALPVSIDEKIGKLAMESMELGGPVIDDPVVTKAVADIVKKLEPHSELKGLNFEIRVVNSPEINAFCLPGGKMVVYTGLLKKVQRPEQVVGVLSHEMAHAIRRHGLQSVAESLGFVAAVELLIGDVGGLVALGVELSKSAALTSYSRGNEIEADEVGVRMMHAAGVDPRELAKFFEMLRDEGKDVPKAIAWISTHPQHDVRIATIRDLLAKLPAKEYRALEMDWADVQKHLAKLNGNAD